MPGRRRVERCKDEADPMGANPSTTDSFIGDLAKLSSVSPRPAAESVSEMPPLWALLEVAKPELLSKGRNVSSERRVERRKDQADPMCANPSTTGSLIGDRQSPALATPGRAISPPYQSDEASSEYRGAKE